MTIAFYATGNPNYAEVEERIAELEEQGYTFPWKSWENQDRFTLQEYIQETIKAIQESEIVFADDLSLVTVSTAYNLGKDVIHDRY